MEWGRRLEYLEETQLRENMSTQRWESMPQAWRCEATTYSQARSGQDHEVTEARSIQFNLLSFYLSSKSNCHKTEISILTKLGQQGQTFWWW